MTTIYSAQDVLLGYKKLLDDGKELKDLVKCDINSIVTGKDYSGVKYLQNAEIYVGLISGDKIEYGYKNVANLKIVKTHIAYGPLAHDHKSRDNTNTGAGVSIRPTAVGAGEQKVGEALMRISEAFKVHLTEYSKKQFEEGQAVKVNVPYKTYDLKKKETIKDPVINIKLKFNLPKGQKNPGLNDTFNITILDATKKIKNGLAPLTVGGKRLCYANMHEIITSNSEISGTIKIGVNLSQMGISLSYEFTSLIVKSAGNNKIDVKDALGDVYADILAEADDDDEEDAPQPNKKTEPEAPTEKDISAPVVDDDF